MLELLFKCLFFSHNYSVFHRHLFFKLEQVIVFSEVPSGLPQWLSGKNLPANQEPQETQVRSLGQEDPLEEGMAIHSSILTSRIPWTEEPGGLQFTRSQRAGHD